MLSEEKKQRKPNERAPEDVAFIREPAGSVVKDTEVHVLRRTYLRDNVTHLVFRAHLHDNPFLLHLYVEGFCFGLLSFFPSQTSDIEETGANNPVAGLELEG